MAHRPNMSPDPRNSIASGLEGTRVPAEDSRARSGVGSSRYDLAGLFAKFEQNSGGTLSPQFSADLALDIVLNEIVEQACLATRASGAAVVLRRGSEFVCRASTGASAPALGAQMDARSGLSGSCIQTGLVQRCDDAESDPRADREASQQLGVRSVMVLPLARPTGMVGILEVMSERPSAFGERDERTLEVLANRALRNVERAADPFLLRADAPVAAPFTQPRLVEETPVPPPVFDAPLSGPIFSAQPVESSSRAGFDLVTFFMGLILLAAVVLLGVLTGRRFGWNSATFRAQAAKASSRVAVKQQNISPLPSAVPDPIVPSSAQPTASAGSQPISDKPVTNTSATPPAVVSDGGLRIYENGREVFRLPASHEAVQGGDRQHEAQAVKWSSTAAESGLVHRVEPDYPETARAQKLQGKVVLEIRIRPDGAVDDIQLISGDPLLAQAAINAVTQWKFKPQTGSGDLAEMQTQVTLNFRLPR